MITIIVPVFNEKNTVKKILLKILKLRIKKQIIVIDDASYDGTFLEIKKIQKKFKNILLIRHNQNQGKGAAIKSAQKYISGEITIIQDADLEYSPNDYFNLIRPIRKKKVTVVYGSRLLNSNFKKKKIFTSNLRIFANIFLTKLSNIINNQNLTDAHTCYKVFDSKLFKGLKLEEKRFGFCPEITTKIANRKIKIIEVPIWYNGRSHTDGKKISFLDGIRAVYCIIRYKFYENRK